MAQPIPMAGPIGYIITASQLVGPSDDGCVTVPHRLSEEVYIGPSEQEAQLYYHLSVHLCTLIGLPITVM